MNLLALNIRERHALYPPQSWRLILPRNPFPELLELLTYDEEVLWKLIWECEVLWRDDFTHRRGIPPQEKDAMLLYPLLRTHWEALQKVAAGEADISMLPRRPREPYAPIFPAELAHTRVGDQGKP
jgi:hypothetical protein